ncbi:hypothetical protein AXF42_Ash016107 [Apostasia shenzhenica]|uniref:C2H2-type domain-containing protein n=1 Tax=Apostasia shenzhenica TaxID=1088818 RepID=A0A2I0B3F6_9ASPA|nr:hypothetical protein AXF42_Ash016107 [Apostasia shenzhenica]
MDSQAQRKALFRSRLRETSKNREKRIDSPLVRYNDDDQPVCRVCNAPLKSESLWPAHQASRKHHEAIKNIKSTASRHITSTSYIEKEKSIQVPQVSSSLPADFFGDAKRQKIENERCSNGLGLADSLDSRKMGFSKPTGEDKSILEKCLDKDAGDDLKSSQRSQGSRDMDNVEVKKTKGILPSGFFDGIDTNGDMQDNLLSQQLQRTDVVQPKQITGALPAGFFDNKDADLRARGIKPVKIDVEDAYKEFEKEIREDLQEVDDRLEEEEIDAAEVREEIESLEQKAYRERVEMVKKKLIEVKESRLAKLRNSPAFKGKDSSEESSSSSEDEDDGDVDFSVDWRAKRL